MSTHHTDAQQSARKEQAIAVGWKMFRIYGETDYDYGSGLSVTPNQNQRTTTLRQGASFKIEA